MLSLEEKNIKILIELGLTYREAKIYYTLNRLGEVTIKDLSENAHMDRPNIYGVIKKLQKLNLVEQIIDSPVSYRAVQLEQGVQMLLEQKKNAFSELSKAAKELLESNKLGNREKLYEESKLMIIPKQTPTVKKFDQLFQETKQLNEAICYWSNPKLSLRYIPIWKKLLKKNVKIRLIVYLKPGKELPKQVLLLTKNPLFKIKYANSMPKIALSIYDKKDAFLTTSMKPSDSMHLWVRSVDFVSFFEEYFEMLWEKSAESNC